jgi:hypothetical protein
MLLIVVAAQGPFTHGVPVGDSSMEFSFNNHMEVHMEISVICNLLLELQLHRYYGNPPSPSLRPLPCDSPATPPVMGVVRLF